MIADVKCVQLPTDIIRTDGDTQSREALNLSYVEDLVEVLQEGNTFKDRIVVYYDGIYYWLSEGFHRFSATEQAGLTTIDAEVRLGTQEDAIENSCASNATHGLRRTKGDVKQAITRLVKLPRWQNRTQEEIAKHIKTTQPYVSIVLRELGYNSYKKPANQPAERVEADNEVRLAALWEEKRQKIRDAFAKFLSVHDAPSNREIARDCGVDEKLVRTIKKELLEAQERAGQELLELEETTRQLELEMAEKIETVPVPEELETDSGIIEPEREPEMEPESVAEIEEDEGKEDKYTPHYDESTPTSQEEEQSQKKPEQVDKSEIAPSPEELELPLTQEEIEQEPLEVARNAPVEQEDTEEILLSTKPDISSSSEENKTETMPNLTSEISEEEALEVYKENLARKRQQKEQMREQRRNDNRQLIAQSKSIDEALAAGARFSTITIDPPWDWGDEGDADQFGRARPTYATMSIDELMAMPVGTYADEDCHIYLWITNRSLPKGFQLLETWGFRYVTCVTWVKPHFGMGNYFRGQTEHLLFGVKGSQALKRHDTGTFFEAPNTGAFFEAPRGPKGHSSKPLKAYEVIESCSPGPYLEMFARSQRPDWTSWGAEA